MIDFIDDKLIETAMTGLEHAKRRKIAVKITKFTAIAAAAAAACFVLPFGISKWSEWVGISPDTAGNGYTSAGTASGTAAATGEITAEAAITAAPVTENTQQTEQEPAAAGLPSAPAFIMPVIDGNVSISSCYSSYEKHLGVDIVSDIGEGTLIYAAADGTVSQAEYVGSYGNNVIIQHENGFETWYGHCAELFVTEGQEVKRGERIASIGTTGYAVEPHLHFEIRLNGNINGEEGSLNIDPALYFPELESFLTEPDKPEEAFDPSGLSTELAKPSDLDCSGGYLLLAQLPQEKIYLYCDNAEVRDKVYIRLDRRDMSEWYEFEQKDVWSDTSVLPEMKFVTVEQIDDMVIWGVEVDYLRHEGTYTDGGGNSSAGLVSEHVVYAYRDNGFVEERVNPGGVMEPVKITDEYIANAISSVEADGKMVLDTAVLDIDFDGVDELLLLTTWGRNEITVWEPADGVAGISTSFGMGKLNYISKLDLKKFENGDDKYWYFTFHYEGTMSADVLAAIKYVNKNGGAYNVQYLLSEGTISYTDIPEPYEKHFYRIGFDYSAVGMENTKNDISEEEYNRLYSKLTGLPERVNCYEEKTPFTELENCQNAPIPEDEFWDGLITEAKKHDPDFSRDNYVMTVNVFSPEYHTGMIMFKYRIRTDESGNAPVIFTDKAVVISFTDGKLDEVMSSPGIEAAKTADVPEEKLIVAVLAHYEGFTPPELSASAKDNIVSSALDYYFEYQTGELRFTYSVFYEVNGVIADKTVEGKIDY